MPLSCAPDHANMLRTLASFCSFWRTAGHVPRITHDRGRPESTSVRCWRGAVDAPLHLSENCRRQISRGPQTRRPTDPRAPSEWPCSALPSMRGDCAVAGAVRPARIEGALRGHMARPSTFTLGLAVLVSVRPNSVWWVAYRLLGLVGDADHTRAFVRSPLTTSTMRGHSL